MKTVQIHEPMRCLVLGGRGFVGSHLIEKMLEHGYFVRCFDRMPATHPDHLAGQTGLELYEGDIMSEDSLLEAMSGCDVCIHLASTTLPKSSNADPQYDIESNLLGSVKLLQQAIKTGIRKIVFLSSGGTVYGSSNQQKISESHPTNPITSYGITKLAIEKYLGLFKQLHGLDYTVLRASNLYGPRQPVHRNQGAVATFLQKALNNEEIEIWGDGHITRDYIYIEDMVSALLSSIHYAGDQTVFNIGSAVGTSLNELLDRIDQILGRPTRRKYLEGRPFDVPANVLDIHLAAQELQWTPGVSLDEGLSKYAKWMTAENNDGN